MCAAEKERLFRANPTNIVFATMAVNTLLSYVVKAMCILDLPQMAVMRPTNIPDRLTALAADFKKRDANGHKHYGEVMMGLFPDGVTLGSAKDFNHMYLFANMLSKLSDYAARLKKGGAGGSLDSLSIYAQMAAELDEVGAVEQKTIEGGK